MASKKATGLFFEIPVVILVTPRFSIGPKDRENMFKYLQKEMSSLQKHIDDVEEVNFVCITDVSNSDKGDILMEFYVDTTDHLSRYHKIMKPPKHGLEYNEFSYRLIKYFEHKDMPKECGLNLKSTISFKVIMDENKRRSLYTELEKQSRYTGCTSPDQKTSNTQVSSDAASQESEPLITKTFIVDIEEKHVLSVRIVSDIKELNREIPWTRKNIYSVDINLPSSCDFDKCYYGYELTFKTQFLYVFRNTKEEKTQFYKLGNKTVYRDALWGLNSYISQFEDIVHDKSSRFSESELCMQIEDLALNCKINEVGKIIDHLLNSGVTLSSISMRRFSLVVGNLCMEYPNAIKVHISAQIAVEMLKSLLQKKLSDFPESASKYMPRLCVRLLEITNENRFCVFLCLEEMNCFLSPKNAVVILQEFLSTHDAILCKNSLCVSSVTKMCKVYFESYVSSKSPACMEVCELILRHIPIDLALENYGYLQDMHDTDVSKDDDSFTSLTASIQLRIISTSNKAIKDRKPKEVFEIALKAGSLMLTKDRNIRKILEDNIIRCFSSVYLPENVNMKHIVEDIITNSGCFIESEIQLQLLRSIAESKTASSRQLLMDFSSHPALQSAYLELDTDTYITCFTNRRYNTDGRGNEIFNIFTALNEFRNIPAVQKRNDLRQALEVKTANILSTHSLRELIQNIDKIEDLCDLDSTIASLYKDQVHRYLIKKGFTPGEVLSYFCTSGRLRVNARTTADIVNSIVGLFFQQLQQSSMYDVCIYLIKHVHFWETIKAGEGTRLYLVEDNAIVKHVISCINKVILLLKQDETDISFLSKIDIHDENTKKLLRCGGMTDSEIRSLKDRFSKRKKEMAITVSNVLNVLHAVQEKKIDGIRSHFDVSIKKVQEINERFQNGSISIKECANVSWLWGDLEELPELCSVLHPVIASTVFWNLGCELSMDAYNETSIKVSSLDVFISVRFLFDEDKTKEDDTILEEIQSNEHTIIFLKALKDEGLKAYEKWWTKLELDSTTPMVDVMMMFKNAIVPEELNVAKVYFKKPLKRPVQDTLLQLSKRNEVIDKADAMKYVLIALGYNVDNDVDMQKALNSFQKLINQDLSQSTLQDVQDSLDTIFALADVLKEDTIHIMTEIGKSTILIDFLKEIAVEDVRNLIDAVEDISESHVQESTVSALIEVKRFLAPLLNSALINEKGSRWIFNTLQKQTDAIGGNAGSLPEKISDCMLNIHNLKSLYDNVANRGQQTREIIKSIVTKGKFCFTLTSDEKVTVDVSYKDNKHTYTKQEASVIDMRSRALLLLNTDRHSKESSFNQEEFRHFIGCVDTCLEIRDILCDLFVSGHVRYSSFNIKCLTNELHEAKNRLKYELDVWLGKMQHARSKYYLMNFIQGFQIHCIHDYLESGVGEEKVNTILHFLHPNLRASNLLQHFSNGIVNDSTLLEELGTALHAVYEGNSMFYRKIGSKERGRKITDSVQTGKLLVAHLEENSEYVIRTVLALYQNTTDCLPEPNQLLFCSMNTSWSDIELLIQRCTGAHGFYGNTPLFCLANVELLQNAVQFRLIDILQQLDDYSNFRLAVVCCGSKNHLFVDRLSDNMSTIQPMTEKSVEWIYHSMFGNVLSYTSDVAGLGKSTAIKKHAMDVDRSPVVVHVSGNFKRAEVIDRLNGLKIKEYHVLHFDIGNVDDPNLLDTFLFELIVMKFVSSSRKLFYLQTDHVCLEIANTINNALTNKLQTPTSFTRQHMLWKNFNDFLPSEEINSPVQVVCHYLHNLENNMLDRVDLKFSGSLGVEPLPVSACRDLLRKHLSFSADISFSIVNIFINVLADQLKKLSSSTFFKVSRISEMIGDLGVPSVRSDLVKAMVEVSIEFASRCVNACRSTQNSTISGEKLEKQDTKAFADKLVERVDSMIRWEDSNHLIYVFHNQNIQTLSPMYRDKSKVPQHITQLFERQMRKKLQDFSLMDQLQLQNMLQRVARSNPEPLSTADLTHMSKEYALTPDNLLKMVLIMLRIQAKIPVVIMGETGCGKTSLIRYLSKICGVPFRVLNIHAGISAKHVEQIVLEENRTCQENPKFQRWLFLDEINTSESIGLICDIICHQRCSGHLLSSNLVIMGACNPYRLRSINAIQTAGLLEKVKTDELSKLVYRVLPLPEMMVDYVWDFGSLSPVDEKKYIERIVEGVFPLGTLHHALFRDLLAISQCFVREKEKSAYVVSLRDVQRCKTLLTWFYNTLKLKVVKRRLVHRSCDSEVRAIILALAHCYHSRFLNKVIRYEYRERLIQGFHRNGLTYFTGELIHDVIKEEQRDIIDRMTLPQGTARNTALQENIFVILVCILNRIPIFVVGKPGCSKSLAMQVIRSNLRGKDSKDDFFKKLPQLYCVSFQGSESSTSDGIIKVFERAEIYQNDNSKDSVLSVVILDEIGLAEVSKFNPLKVLHNLLEPDGMNVPNVAVVGISNWALDASKMNRAIHLSRPDMDEEELNETAVSISESFIENTNISIGLTWSSTQDRLSIDEIKDELRQIARSYSTYVQKQQYRNFHGLRDFYSLVKYISRKFAKEFKDLSPENKAAAIMEGLLRNFGGLKTGRPELLHHFNECFHDNKIKSCSNVVDLIKSNIMDDMARHLMIITKGESVLGLVDEILRKSNRDKKETIFGSQFEEDLTDDYNYRILSRVILCMEQGIVLVLKDLDHIYGSLYDMLNQNYTRIGKKNNCRIALGPYSNPFCHVAESFRCIVLVEESRLDYTDPPFLNRFEKQFLTFADILEDDESKMVEELKKWVENVTTIDGMPFSADNAFPYYNEELVVSLVINECRKTNQINRDHLLDVCKHKLLWIIRPEVVVRLPNVIAPEIKMVSDSIRQAYFDLPLHNGIGCFVKHQLTRQEHLTVIFTNSNIHTKISAELIDIQYQSEKLGSFKSEKQLSVKLQQFWKNEDTNVLLVHCSAVDDDRHIMLTKSLIERNHTEHNEQGVNMRPKFVFLIIHLEGNTISMGSFSESFYLTSPSISQINYLSGWKLALLDCLKMPKIALPHLCSRTLKDTVESQLPLSNYLKEELFWAFTRIQYGPNGRSVDSIRNMIAKISCSEMFLAMMSDCIWSIIEDTLTGEENEDWCLHVACDIESLNTSVHFTDALERKIRQVIKNPFAKLVYRLEVMGTLDSYFEEDEHCQQRRAFWYSHLRDEKLMALSLVKDVSGPACFFCNTPDLQLKMPFSLCIFESEEQTKYLFVDEVIRTKIKCDLESDDILPVEVYNVLVVQHQSYMSTKIPDAIETHAYDGLNDDYVTDFCNLYSHTFSVTIPAEQRIHYMKWAFGQKMDFKKCDFVTLCAFIHCAGWTHFSLFNSSFRLFELCQNVLCFDQWELFMKLRESRMNNKECAQSYQGSICCSAENLSNQEENKNTPYAIPSDITFDCTLEIMDKNGEQASKKQELAESEHVEIDETKFEKRTSTKTINIIDDECAQLCQSSICCLAEDLSDQEENKNTPNANLSHSTFDNTLDIGKKSSTKHESSGSKYVENHENKFEQRTSSELSSLTVAEFSGSSEIETISEAINCNLESTSTEPEEKSHTHNIIPLTNIGDKVNVSGSIEIDTEQSFVADNCFSDNSSLVSDSFNLEKKSDSNSDLDASLSNADEDVFNLFVAFVCKRLLPTSDNLKFFVDVKHWQMTARNVLILASEVSTDCPELHALRLCDDIVSDVLLPQCVDQYTLEHLAVNMKESCIDSYEVFSVILSILKENEVSLSSRKIQRMLCQYIIRCLSTDPDTKAYKHLFNAITDANIPGKEMQMLKPPLRYLLQQELDENEDIFLDLLQGNCDVLSSSGEEKEMFLFDLDLCLKSLKHSEHRYCHFEMLIIDLLQDTCTYSIEDERCGELLLSCGKCIQQENSGLKLLIAVAFLKEITIQITKSLTDEPCELNSHLFTNYDAAVSMLQDQSKYNCLLEYFIKCLMKDNSLHKVAKICRNFELQLNFVRSIKWPDDLSKILEENPFCVHPFATKMKEAKRLMGKQQNTESFQESLCKLQELGRENLEHEGTIIFATAMHEFYMVRSHRSLDATDRLRSDMFYKHFEAKYTNMKMELLECLLGTRDFEIADLIHNEESSLQQVMMNSVLLATLILSVCSVSKGHCSPILKECLLKPLSLKTAFLPGFPDGTESLLNNNSSEHNSEKFEFVLCQCETRLAIKHASKESLHCVVCKRNLKSKGKATFSTQLLMHSNIQEAFPKPGFSKNGDLLNCIYPIRLLSPVSVNIVQLFVKGCLLGSLNAQLTTFSEMEDLLNGCFSAVDGSLSLVNELSHHWTNLGQMLNLDDHDLACFLQLVLVKSDRLLYREGYPFTSIEERNIWEAAFEDIISEVLLSRAEAINEIHREHVRRFSLPFDSVEVAIQEVDNIHENLDAKVWQDVRFKELFRFSSKPSKADFVCQLWALRKEFPFLARVIENEKGLVLPKHIYNIVQWHLSTVVKTSYQMKRQDCLTMSVQEFLDKHKDAGQIKSLRHRFKELQKSWIEIKKTSQEKAFLTNLKEINFETKMAECLILNEECDLFKILVFLIKIQNDFIDMSLQEAFTCRNLQFLLRNENLCCVKSIPVSEIKKDHLIDIKFEWTETIVQGSNSKLEYGLGKQIIYDLHNIEKGIAVKMLVKSAYINLKSLPQIIFADELYRNFVDLIANVSESVRQECLPSEIESFFVKKNVEYSNMSLELLNHLDMILALLRNAKWDHQKPLKVFIEERTVILGNSFPLHYLPSPESRLKLCHVVSLHEVLEEISAERVIGGFSYEFNVELENDVRDHLTKVTASSIKRSEIVLKSIKRFIYRCMYMGESNPGEKLLHYLSHPSFWPKNVLKNGKLLFENKEDELADIIPSSVRVCHVVDVVKHIHDAIENQREEEVRIDQAISSWKNKPDQNAKANRQKKAAKKIKKAFNS